MKVIYVRDRPGRHSRQPILVRSAASQALTDRVMGKIGFVREGTQLPLAVPERCCKCGGRDFITVRLPDEVWCRPCIKRTFGGEL